jgi:hypothetical protein
MRALLLLVFLTASLAAHHGSADYDTSREITVTGIVREWRWTQPHTWVYVTVAGASGAAEVWDGEGPPLTWAEQRKWSATTLRAGETVSLVMYPWRREARTGLVKSIRRAGGEVLAVSRPWLPKG